MSNSKPPVLSTVMAVSTANAPAKVADDLAAHLFFLSRTFDHKENLLNFFGFPDGYIS